MSLGGSVQEACDAIQKHWKEHGAELRAAAAAEAAAATQAAQAKAAPPPAPEPAKPASPKLSVGSVPEGADIEIDGNFMGNTPSAVELASGDHVVSIKKNGYKPWERKVKLTGGEIKINAELEKNVEQAANPQ